MLSKSDGECNTEARWVEKSHEMENGGDSIIDNTSLYFSRKFYKIIDNFGFICHTLVHYVLNLNKLYFVWKCISKRNGKQNVENSINLSDFSLNILFVYKKLYTISNI